MFSITLLRHGASTETRTRNSTSAGWRDVHFTIEAHGVPGETRTPRNWLLRPARLPFAPPEPPPTILLRGTSPMAVGAPYNTLSHLCLDLLERPTLKGHCCNTPVFGTAYMIKVEDRDVLFPAINAWVVLQVLPQVFSERLTNHFAATSGLPYVVAPVMFVISSRDLTVTLFAPVVPLTLGLQLPGELG